ncbi:pirin family protein [Pseudobacteriovorax antillogorgiicola]|uniref:Pirin N-terminal domain-containing protein n=1 Tax=Pseudobacteriovorax antillogorgiicola TaxID=1513793 RepID=A0A1Y6BKQ1_9BACT|nr:pirin family protein [Pseudobacteriovorax antillogorgiicola]TCS56278.1 hypothetical protein EDD56_104100 [Pseudobacteriovorax antillogorgiicola]SMF07691.1 hypothetical protein SAMN06296036_104233 [Pseudobacteriovorax antillogorgiicola]
MARKLKPLSQFQYIPSSELSTGSFDAGKITEVKLIGFAGEPSPLLRLGPLFYWAWATARSAASIPSHPHRGFEIISYVIDGVLEHRDSLGHIDRLGPGDLQVMQTGSGLEHEEHFVTTPCSMFQIWFDPNFRQKIKERPRYKVIRDKEISSKHIGTKSTIKTLISPAGGYRLDAPVSVMDIEVGAEGRWQWHLAANTACLAFIIKGLVHGRSEHDESVARPSDGLLWATEDGLTITLQAEQDSRLLLVTVDQVPTYPLFPKPKPRS